MIHIKPSTTADTRTCDPTSVDITTLQDSSLSHIHDVQRGMAYFASLLIEAGIKHDFDKVSSDGLAAFHSDFVTGFKRTGWWDNHRAVNRHHINMEDGVRDDVDLVDVIEHVVDCVTAGLARSGKFSPIELPASLLQRAVANTASKLVEEIVVGG